MSRFCPSYFGKFQGLPISFYTVACRYGHFNWRDPLEVVSLLTEDEIKLQKKCRSICEEQLQPRILKANRNETRGDLVGCFALTEPKHGSDPSRMESFAEYDEKNQVYILSGSKMWISNAPIADIFIVIAKAIPENKFRGFILTRGMPGLSTSEIEGRLSLRALSIGSIEMENVHVPEENLIPGFIGLKAPLACLNSARYGIAWGALGAAEFCFETARQYTVDRHQFGRPLASNQLVQKKLADMMAEIALGFQACVQVSR
ncbi:Glutaryl-CoA dehydrogenase [Fasciolopsis buskii]|uniref:Glutaryl-CoA dehydrogenase n=1 Tax=Fasciolopsis buskii TaxID=27845 RepID=A0A8E0VMQ2_9TREM|nr:Glutaryl-CoA dehydrogenase [Fasciolopsis buski]